MGGAFEGRGRSGAYGEGSPSLLSSDVEEDVKADVPAVAAHEDLDDVDSQAPRIPAMGRSELEESRLEAPQARRGHRFRRPPGRRKVVGARGSSLDLDGRKDAAFDDDEIQFPLAAAEVPRKDLRSAASVGLLSAAFAEAAEGLPIGLRAPKACGGERGFAGPHDRRGSVRERRLGSGPRPPLGDPARARR